MFVAQELKHKNICEYLLYMWQVEDTVRAFGLDAGRIASEYLSRFPYDDAQRAAAAKWYARLAAMMREEGVGERGHLSLSAATLGLLEDCHTEALDDPDAADYSAAYYKALPYIVELRARGCKDKSEVETCLDALYGALLLRLQKKPVGRETQQALDTISHLLARRWKEVTNQE